MESLHTLLQIPFADLRNLIQVAEHAHNGMKTLLPRRASYLVSGHKRQLFYSGTTA